MTRARFVETATRQDAAEHELLGLRRGTRQRQLQAACLLAQIDRTGHYAFRGCSSVAHYGEQFGMSGREARTLAAVGRAIALRPDLKELVLDGRLSLDAIAALSKILADPSLVRDGEDWIAWAEEWSAYELERAVRKRIVECESGEPTSTLTAVLTAPGREKFERARQLASRKEKKLLSEGQAIEVLSDHYLDSFDVERKKPGRRRMPDTKGQPGRHVPAEVIRAILARQGDRCPVPGCDHTLWMQKAHIIPHCKGGSREASNLIYVCWQHHQLLDRGILLLHGTPENPVFKTKDGRTLGRDPP